MDDVVSLQDTPLISTLLARLRHQDTQPPEFRRLIHQLSGPVLTELSEHIPTRFRKVPTPLGVSAEAVEIDAPIFLMPVLRSGLGMQHAGLDLFPEANVCHLGLRRIESGEGGEIEAEWYYENVPNVRDWREDPIAILLDPMLATGSSAMAACALLRDRGFGRILFAGIIAAPEGIHALMEAHDEVRIVVAAIDARLNERKFIVPGLGDAGDRQFPVRKY